MNERYDLLEPGVEELGVPEATDEDPRSGWNLPALMRLWAGPFTDLKEEWPTWGVRSPFETLVARVRSSLVGRRVDTEVGGERLAFTLSELNAGLEPLGATAGQADNVSLSALRVEYAGFRVEEATAMLRNVRTRVGTRPQLVCAPVELTLGVTSEQAAAVLEDRGSRFVAAFHDSDQLRVRLRRHPSWGWVDLRPTVTGGRIALRPVAIGRPSRNRQLRRRWPAWTVPVSLPPSARVVDLHIESERLVINVRIDEWRFAYERIFKLTRQPQTENQQEGTG